jgi:arginine decarboxylase-like protein
MEMCEATGIAHPTLVSESGRATVAHHCILVVDVLGASEFRTRNGLSEPPEAAHAVVWNLYDTYKELTSKNLLEAYHDALQYKDESLTLFALGHLSLEERVLAEDYFWGICQKLLRLTRDMEDIPEDLEGLERLLADTYFCNFSIFQSIPDSWAVNQLFPIMPIHRLQEEPSRRAVLADITCDSDGKIDAFIDRRDVKHVIALHPLNGQEYYLGFFPGGGLSGNSRRPAQSLWRHKRSACVDCGKRRVSSGARRSRGYGGRCVAVCELLARGSADALARSHRACPPEQTYYAGGCALLAEDLRGRARQLYLP